MSRDRDDCQASRWEPIVDLDHVLRPGVDQRRFICRQSGECKPWVFVDCAPGLTLRRWLDNLNPVNWEFRKPATGLSGNCGTCVKLRTQVRKLRHQNFALRMQKEQLESQINERESLPTTPKKIQHPADCRRETDESLWLVFDNARKVLLDERAAFQFAIQMLRNAKELPCNS